MTQIKPNIKDGMDMSVAQKKDQGKAMLSRIDPGFLAELADVLEFGQKKYDWDNWKKGFGYHRLLDATLRHVYAMSEGQNLDPESGKSHVAHAACNLMFLSWHMRNRPDLDDRIPQEQFLLFRETHEHNTEDENKAKVKVKCG